MKNAVERRQSTSSPSFGHNMRNLGDWRARLAAAAEGKSFRTIAERCFDESGHRMAHSTIRSALMGSGGVQVTTIAAICDALGVQLTEILGGATVVQAIPPPNFALPPGQKADAIPIAPLSETHRFNEAAGRRYIYLEPGDRNRRAAIVEGAAMAPKFKKGDIVIYSQGGKPNKGQYVLVQIDGQANTVLRQWGGGKDRVRLDAVNPEFGSQEVAASRITVVGIVIGHIAEID